MFIRTRFTRWISFGFAAAITLFPFVLIAPGVPLSRRLVIHEKIHLRQQAELLLLPFYLLYLLEFITAYYRYGNQYQAYRHISFEKEAYAHEGDSNYLKHRPLWNWRHYQ